MNHTQGPLTVAPHSSPTIGTDWRTILAVGVGKYEPIYVGEAREADAVLFAAAPELLAAMKAFVALCPSTEGMGGHAPIGAFVVIAGQARAAIAKATGGTL